MKNVINHFMIYYLCIMLLATAMGYFLSSYVKKEDVPKLVELEISAELRPELCRYHSLSLTSLICVILCRLWSQRMSTQGEQS